MLLIPAKNKEFIMGKTMGRGYDSPQHTVLLSSDYYMCKYEVTRSLWYAIMNDAIVTEEGMLPMTHITWNDAETFTKKLNKLTGLPFSEYKGKRFAVHNAHLRQIQCSFKKRQGCNCL